MKRWAITQFGLEFSNGVKTVSAIPLTGNETFTGAPMDMAVDEATFVEVRSCLVELVALKTHKNVHGKTEHYESAQPKAWEHAKEVLERTHCSQIAEQSIANIPIPKAKDQRAMDWSERIAMMILIFATLAFAAKVCGW